MAVHRHNRGDQKPIRSLAMPTMGAGFGNVAYCEVARRMAVAYENYLDPPLALDWDTVIE